MSAMIARLGIGDRTIGIVTESSQGSRPGTLVSSSDLVESLDNLAYRVDIVAFVDGDRVDQETMELIREMVTDLGASDALTSAEPVSDAIKEIRDGVIVRSVDRTALVYGTTPSVIKRDALDLALGQAENDIVDPVTAVALSGGVVRLHTTKDR